MQSGLLRQVDQRHQPQSGARHQAQHEGVEREQSSFAADDRMSVVDAETDIKTSKTKTIFLLRTISLDELYVLNCFDFSNLL